MVSVLYVLALLCPRLSDVCPASVLSRPLHHSFNHACYNRVPQKFSFLLNVLLAFSYELAII